MFLKRVVWHPRATFHAFIVPRACRMEPSRDISCFNCSPSVSRGTLGRRFMLLSFLMRALRNPRATFHALIVPQACRMEPSGGIIYHYRSSRVLPDTLGVCFMSKLFPKRVVWHPRATFHALIVPQACRVTPLSDILCLNCSPSVSCDTLGRRFMP